MYKSQVVRRPVAVDGRINLCQIFHYKAKAQTKVYELEANLRYQALDGIEIQINLDLVCQRTNYVTCAQQ